jgi:hypothetical protein
MKKEEDAQLTAAMAESFNQCIIRRMEEQQREPEHFTVKHLREMIKLHYT